MRQLVNFNKFAINEGQNRNELRKTRVFSNAAYIKFREEIQNNNWRRLENKWASDMNQDNMYNEFSDVFVRCCTKAFPNCEIKVNSKTVSTPWMTPSLIRACYRKSKLLKIRCKYPTETNKINFTNYRNTLKMTLRTAERSYYQKLFH